MESERRGRLLGRGALRHGPRYAGLHRGALWKAVVVPLFLVHLPRHRLDVYERSRSRFVLVAGVLAHLVAAADGGRRHTGAKHAAFRRAAGGKHGTRVVVSPGYSVGDFEEELRYG